MAAPRSRSSWRKPRPRVGPRRTPSHQWRPRPDLGAPGSLEKALIAVWWFISKTKLRKFLTRPLLTPALHTAGRGDPPRRLGPLWTQNAPGTCAEPGATGRVPRSTWSAPARTSLQSGRPAGWHTQRLLLLLLLLGSADGPEPSVFWQGRHRASHIAHSAHCRLFAFESPWTELRDLCSGRHGRT